MQNLIHKWKKIINNEKTEQTTDFLDVSIKDVKENTFSTSVISERSNKFNNKTKSVRFSSSERNFMRSNSSQSKTGNEDKSSIIEPDKAIQLLKKTIILLQKSQDNNNTKIIIENLNEVIDSHIECLNHQRLKNKNFEEKEVIWKTKCDTAEKMMKDLELKILSLEKEKARLKKHIDELNENLEEYKEKSEYLLKSKEMILLLEKNNNILIKTNTSLNEQLDEQKKKYDLLINKFNSEATIIKERLEVYKCNLNKVLGNFYEGKIINE